MNRRSFVSSATLAFARPGAAQSPPEKAANDTILHVAACQILTFADVKKSAEKICSWIEKAAAESVDVVVFPEAAICGYTCDPAYWRDARPADFQAAEETVLSLARRLKIAVILGTAHWDDGHVFDSVLIIDRGGRVLGRYSKTYLAEAWPTPGRGKLPLRTVAGVKSCFIICHDIRYPELVRLPAIAGAQICYFPSNESGLVQEHKLSAYRSMPISRATENSIYLVMANAPADPRNMLASGQSHGNSKIVHPDGNVLAEAGYFKETLVSAAIDLKAATRAMARRAIKEDTITSKWLRAGLQLVDDEVS